MTLKASTDFQLVLDSRTLRVTQRQRTGKAFSAVGVTRRSESKSDSARREAEEKAAAEKVEEARRAEWRAKKEAEVKAAAETAEEARRAEWRAKKEAEVKAAEDAAADRQPPAGTH